MMDTTHLLSRLIEASLAAVDPAMAVRRYLRREGTTLLVGEQRYHPTRLFVVGMGKAAATMAVAVETIAGDLVADGVVITKDGYACETEVIRVREAAHPLPDARGVAATREMMRLLQKTGPDDPVLVLVSGGGSALLVAPVEGVTLADLQTTTELLLASGATIHELNAVRKHLSVVKGGQLVRYAAPSAVVTLIISDVVGDDLDVIASGPTVPDHTTFAEAVEILRRYGLWERVPAGVRAYLLAGLRGERRETPKPGDPLFADVRNWIIARNADAAEAAVRAAREAGWQAYLLTTFLQGEAREVARVIAALGQQVVRGGTPWSLPLCLVFGGETTVTMRGNGLGGRNQELALAAALAIEGWSGITIASLATDGGDGPTDAAGGVVDGMTAARIRAAGIDPRQALAANDSHRALSVADALLRIGPTGTNVTDLIFLMVTSDQEAGR